ncbi:MAG: SBBP repeat-containing protein [bacterium]
MIKKFKSIILILMLCIAVKADAQVSEQWVETFNFTGNSSDNSFAVAADNFGNSYVTGSVVNLPHGTDYCTIKYNSAGVREWTKLYNGTSNMLDYGRDIVADNAGNAYVTGYANTNTAAVTIKYSPTGDSLWVRDYFNGSCYIIVRDANDNIYVAGKWGDDTVCDFLVIKYNSAGIEQWSRKYAGPGNGPDFAYGLQVDNSGNVYLTGAVYVGPFNAIATVKYNSSGVQQWDAIYDCPAFGSDRGNSVDVDSSGNVYVGGYSDTAITGRDFITIKYNSSGLRQWVKRYDGGSEEIYTVRVFDQNNIYVNGPGYGTSGNYDFTTVKYNGNGDQLWVRSYDGNHGSDYPQQMILDGAGNIYITGAGQLTGSWEDIITIKYDPAGTLLWNANYTGAGNNPDAAFDIAINNAGNVFVTGRSYGGATVEDFVTIKYSQTTSIQLISGIIPDRFDLAQNYPNPFNPSTSINFNLPLTSQISLKLYDVSGKEIAELLNEVRAAGHYSYNFNAEHLAGGVYFYSLLAKGFKETKKMVIIK